jgi:Bacterial Ig domain/Bacterial cadherin-like domain
MWQRTLRRALSSIAGPARHSATRSSRKRSHPKLRFDHLEDRTVPTGGDFSLDFVASAPSTYNHVTGGGAFDDRTIGTTNDVVESLEGGQFTCGDIVTHLVAIKVKDNAVGAQTIALDFNFTADSTGQSGAAYADIVGVGINYGAVSGGDGPGSTDSGMIDDGGSSAVLSNEHFQGTVFTSGANLLGTVTINDLEHGEQVILRIDVRIDCVHGSHPTGNLQAAINGARVVLPTPDAIGVGNQTVPLKKVEELNEPPVANADAFDCVDVTHSFTMTKAQLVGNDTDPDGDPLTITQVSSPSAQGGTVVLNADQSVTYTPSPSYSGIDTFTYTISDGKITATATVSLELNHAPVAANDAYGVNQGGTLNVPAAGVLANDSDADGNALALSLVTGPAHGTLTLNPDGSFSYVNDGPSTADDSFV